MSKSFFNNFAKANEMHVAVKFKDYLTIFTIYIIY